MRLTRRMMQKPELPKVTAEEATKKAEEAAAAAAAATDADEKVAMDFEAWYWEEIAKEVAKN